jgi:hypothetical protein
MGRPSTVVQTTCKDCDVQIHWKVDDVSRSREDWQPLDGEPCAHRQEHHEAGFRSRMNKSGRAYAGPVAGRVLTRQPGDRPGRT